MNNNGFNATTSATSDLASLSSSAMTSITWFQDSIDKLKLDFDFLKENSIWKGSRKDAFMQEFDEVINNLSSTYEKLPKLVETIELIANVLDEANKQSINDKAMPIITDALKELQTYYVGPCANFTKDQREEKTKFLFEDGLPTSAAVASSYMKTIQVPVIIFDENGNKVRTTTNLTVHEKLADDYTAIFEEMADKGFPMEVANDTPNVYGYNFRTIKGNSTTSSLSHHSYGTAVDINPVNNAQHTSGNANSPYYINDEIVEIWKNHGFCWGGDWDSNYIDPMHFTYIGS